MQQINESDVKNLGVNADLVTTNKSTMVAAINEIKRLLNGVTGIAPSDILNLVADFNFAVYASITLNGGTGISAITDAVAGVSSSQATTASQPGYSAAGGPNGTPCATFNGSQTLAGALLTASTEFTYIVLRKIDPSVASNATIGLVHNGNASTGYGIVECQPSSPLNDITGGFFPGVTAQPGSDYFSYKGQWEVVVMVHTAGRTTYFNSLGVPFKAAVNLTSNPAVPTTGHYIGTLNFSGVVPFKGSISRVLLYNRALSRAEVKAVATYLQATTMIGYPNQVVFDGDSKFTSLGGSPNAPEQSMIALRTAAKYDYIVNKAVAGRTSNDVLINIQADAVANFRPEVINVFVMMIGHNDLNSSISAATTYSNIQAICAIVRAAGYKIIICTDIYNSTGVSNGTANNTNKDTFNASIRSGYTTFADGLADLNAISQLTAANMVAGGTYTTDGIHPNAAATALMGPVIETALATII